MLREEIIKNIEMIDDELDKNEKFMNEHKTDAVYILQVTSKLLIDARKMWVNMLAYEYGEVYK